MSALSFLGLDFVFDPEKMKKFTQSIDLLLEKLGQWGRSDLVKSIGQRLQRIVTWSKETFRSLISYFQNLWKTQSLAWSIVSLILGIIATLTCMASIYDDYQSYKKNPDESTLKLVVKSGIVVATTAIGGALGHVASPFVGIGYGMFVGAMIGAGIRWLFF